MMNGKGVWGRWALVWGAFSAVSGAAGCLSGGDSESADDEAGDEIGVAESAVVGLGLPRYVPPRTGGGDADFYGHGPAMTVMIDLFVNETRQLCAAFYIHAKETKSDWTEAEGTAYYCALTAGSIAAIGGPTHFETGFTDGNGHADNVLTFPPGTTFVNTLTCVGDRKGKDAGVWTGCDATFHNIPVTYTH